MSEIIINKLSKTYNQGQSNEVQALKEASFKAKSGEFIVILGASGAGKSTLLNLLGGMDKATSGSYIIKNEGKEEYDVTSLKENQLAKFRREDVGFVFQFYNLMPNLTALENIQLAESVVKDSLGSKNALEAVGLTKRANNFPSQLSGGEQQRVAIARAIVKKPALLLCDEPTGALDSKTGCQVLTLLKDLSKKQKSIIMIVTHNALIAEVATRVITIADGKIKSDKKNRSPKDPSEIAW